MLVGLSVTTFVLRSLSLMGEVPGGMALLPLQLIVSAKPLEPTTNVAIQTGVANVAHPPPATGLIQLRRGSAGFPRGDFALSPAVCYFGTLFGPHLKQPSSISERRSSPFWCSVPRRCPRSSI